MTHLANETNEMKFNNNILVKTFYFPTYSLRAILQLKLKVIFIGICDDTHMD
jgi:hypothetical protein